MKRLLLLALLLIPATAGAIPIPVLPALVHAHFVTCMGCFPVPKPLYTFDAFLTIVPSSGEYFAPGLQGNIRAASDIGEVAALSGTLNGDPIMLTPHTGLNRSWVLDLYFPGNLAFMTSDGRGFGLSWDRGPIPLFGGTGVPGDIPVLWSVTEVTPLVQTPEPAPLLLVALGLPMIASLARRLRA